MFNINTHIYIYNTHTISSICLFAFLMKIWTDHHCSPEKKLLDGGRHQFHILLNHRYKCVLKAPNRNKKQRKFQRFDDQIKRLGVDNYASHLQPGA